MPQLLISDLLQSLPGAIKHLLLNTPYLVLGIPESNSIVLDLALELQNLCLEPAPDRL